MKFSLGVSFITLIWGIYYLVSRGSGNLLSTWDICVSVAIIIISLISIGLYFYRQHKK